MLNEESEHLKSNKESISQKFHKRISPAYKKSKLFLGLFIIGIPLLFSPVNYIYPDIFYPVSIVMSTIIGVFIFWNRRTIELTLQGLKNPSTSDYNNVLNIIENMPKIQEISGIITGISITGLILLNIANIAHSSTTESLRLTFLNMLISSVMIVAFSSIHMITYPVGKKYSLYLTNAWIMSIELTSKDSEKMKRLMNCIENYDDFLHKVLKQRINTLDQLYVKFVLHASKDLDTIINEIKEKCNQKEFPLLRYLQEYKNEDNTSIIVIKPLKRALLTINADILKNISIIIGSIAPIIVLVIKEIFPIVFPNLKIV